MKQHTTALLLSALLLSTFASDFHFKSAHAPISKHSRHLVSTRSKPNITEGCAWTCEDSSTGGNGTLTVIIKGNGSFIAIVNVEAKVAIVFDTSAGLVAIFDGTSGAVVVFNYKNGTGIYVSGGKCHHAWLASNSNFKDYFSSLSLTVIFETYQQDGIRFDKDSINSETSQFIVQILIHISEEYAIKFKDSTSTSPALVLSVLLEISNRVSNVSSSGVISLFVAGTTVTTVEFSLKIGITGFVSRLEGIVVLVGRVDGGIKVLIEKSIKFNLVIILNARRGSEVFIYLIKQLTVHFKISAILGSASFSAVILLVGYFEGGSEGFQVFLLMFSALLDVARTHGKDRDINEIFIKYLIQVSITIKGRGNSFREELQNLFSFLLQIEGLSSDVIKHLKDGKDKKLEINSVRFSIIFELIFKYSERLPLYIIVAVLLKVEAIKAEVAILQLLIILFKYLNSRTDRYIIVQIIGDPSIKDIVNITSDNYLGELLKRLSRNIIAQILRGNILVILEIGGTIGVILEWVDKALRSESKDKSLTLKVVFTSHGSIEFIKTLSGLFTGAYQGGGEIIVEPVTHPNTPVFNSTIGISIGDGGNGNDDENGNHDGNGNEHNNGNGNNHGNGNGNEHDDGNGNKHDNENGNKHDNENGNEHDNGNYNGGHKGNGHHGKGNHNGPEDKHKGQKHQNARIHENVKERHFNLHGEQHKAN